jgi:glycosyltransferase involved in cell wall biosynthesis
VHEAQGAGEPRISVVMPVRDAAATLAAAVESLLAQTEPAWELLAVDDGSTDGSAALLRAYARRDRRIRVLGGERRGLPAALNAGLAAAAGPLIARLDADDACAPERLARQRHHLEARPEVGLVASRVRFGGDPRRAAGYARHVAWTNGLLAHEEIALARFVESPLAHPSVMFRRVLVERLGGYRAGDFPEDYELWLRWLEAGVRMEKLAETLLVWNDSPGRLSRRDPRYGPEAFYRLKGPYLARWLRANNPHHPAVLLWGAGRVTRRRARHLVEHGVAVEAFVDVDPRKVGRRLQGRPVLAPAALPPPGRAFVVSYVGGAGARDLIEASLRARGYRPGADYILAA